MNIVKHTNKNQEAILSETLDILLNDGVVVAPSETTYIFAANSESVEAVKKVLLIKGREDEKLPLIIGSRKILDALLQVNDREKRLMNDFWPGPVTLLLKIKEAAVSIARNCLGNNFSKNCVLQNKLAVRISPDPIAAALSNRLNLPIISTSANISGQPACYDVESLMAQFEDNEVLPDLIIDAGPLPQVPPSTILDLSQQPYKIIRPGADFEEVKKFLYSLYKK